MNMRDIVVVAVIIIIGSLAFLLTAKDKKNGKGCGGNCLGCSADCKTKIVTNK